MTQREKETSLLVVDDEEEIREMISDYLRDSEEYIVYEVESGEAALEFLKTRQVDLILSDINMPGMKGFDLLKEVRHSYPMIKRVLITAYNVEDYLDLALKHDIGNIFVKTTPFNFDELCKILNNLLTSDIFGIDRYFSPGYMHSEYKVSSSKCLDKDAKEITKDIKDTERARKLELVIVELLTNAIFYGMMSHSPESKALLTGDIVLPEGKEIEVHVGIDSEKYAVSVLDRGGRLSKFDVLYWLNRQVARDDKGLPLGVFDTHGRGFYIARRYIDRLIINIDKDTKTEIIIINYFSNEYQGYKPLYINEI
jgi:CheY-like chemotaxis protein/anti-sigma regulatory factor (Ser/Thr protein kinase)